jgi:DHA1 family multidrug resistance protein-like MFS transporter
MVPQAFVTQWWQLAALRCLMGMSVAGLLPAVAKALRSAVDPGQLGKVLGYLQSSQFTGQVLGPLVGGVVGAHVGLRHVFFVTSGLLLACAWLNWRCVRIPFHGGHAA